MTRIGEEGAGVRQHADEIAEDTEIGKRSHLFLHAGLGVVEPPAGALLDFTGNFISLEASDQAADQLIVRGVEGKENRLRAFAGYVERREEIGNAAAAVVLGNHVKTGVRPHLGKHAGVVVAFAGVMNLHDNAETVVFLAEMHEDRCLILFGLFQCQRFACHSFLEGCSGFLHGVFPERNVIQAVVTGTATEGGKVLQTVRQCLADTSGTLDFFAGYGFQLPDVFRKTGFCDVDGFVRAERRADFNGNRWIIGDFFVPFERINRIVGRADKSDI